MGFLIDQPHDGILFHDEGGSTFAGSDKREGKVARCHSFGVKFSPERAKAG